MMDARNRARWASVAVLAVVFASGIVVGLAWDRQLDAAEAEGAGAGTSADAVAESSEGNEAEDGERRRRRPMYEQVEPTEAQAQLIDSIVQAYRDDVRAFHRESRDVYDRGMRALVVEARESIKSVLTAEQAARYDSLTAARDARARERESGRSDGRDDDGGRDRN